MHVDMHDENNHKKHTCSPSKKLRLANGVGVRASNHAAYNGFQKDDSIIQKQKRSLPIYPVRWKILQEIRKYNNVIVIGETGSGKTTQIPQVTVYRCYITVS